MRQRTIMLQEKQCDKLRCLYVRIISDFALEKSQKVVLIFKLIYCANCSS
jgi:hypothetical protein